MRILYIAPVRDFSGYAAAARGYIAALHAAGADLVVRPVRYDRADAGTEYVPTAVEAELMKKPLENIDVVIQHTTPNEMRPVAGKVNIAVCAWETTKIPAYWAKKLNQFNAVFTFCEESIDAFTSSGVTVPVFKVPHTFDIPSYTLDGVSPIVSPSAPDCFKDRFVFYNISQFSTKKGIDVLLKAYLLGFHGMQDKVMLVLKTYIDMANRNTERQKLQSFVASVKSALRLEQDKYPPVMLITSTLTDEQIKKLHRTGHAYVCSSRAEGWCIPAFEALAYGNKLVTTDWGGMGEFAVNKNQVVIPEGTRGMIPGTYTASIKPKSNVFLVDYHLEPLIGQGHPDPELYTAKEFIAEPSTNSMVEAMQNAMNKTLFTKPSLMEFDYSNVGPLMLRQIESVKNEAMANV